MRQRAAELRAALPGESTLLYSLKANPLPPVVAALRSAGCGAEVSSVGELGVALASRTSSTPVLYTGPAKSTSEIRSAIRAGAVLSCESWVEVARIAAAVEPGDPRVGVILRLQPPSRPAAGLSMADGGQFGFLEGEAVDLCLHPPREVEVLGFHCYLGSQLATSEVLLAGFAEAFGVVERVADGGHVRPRVVDLGGGFPWPYAAPGAGPDLSSLRD
ncbi:MAG: type III PLP-dependent enzyme, partial [Acidimicrobiia bacterium]